MAYQVLYRKYRPRHFADVVGQPQVTVTLKNELMAGRIAHAYLFTGSRGTGKTTCARILAKAVNCLNPQDGDPCGECEVCRGIDSGSVMDIVEIDAASNNGIDSIRSLIEESSFTPGTCKYRVYIIDEVHELSDNAFNALLKTLEEPPPHVLFILATTEVHELLPTILSRCQRFDFKRIIPSDIAHRLAYIAHNEGAEIDEDAALLIARIADGGMRDAISMLDQCIGRSDNITLEVVNETAGIAGSEHLFALAAAIREGESSKALEIINQLHENSKDLSKLCEEMSDHFRKLMLVKTMKNPEVLIGTTKEDMEKLRDQGLSTSLSVILHCISSFQNTLDRMKFSNQRTELEMTFIKLCTPELDTSTEALLRRIEALEKGAPKKSAQASEIKSDLNIISEQKIVEKPSSAPQKIEGGQSGQDELTKAAVPFREWPEVLQIMKQYSQSVSAAFNGSSAYTSSNFVLVKASQFAFDLLKNSTQRERLKEAIAQVTGKNYNLGPYRGEDKKTEEKQDPIATLEKRAEEAGIEVNNI